MDAASGECFIRAMVWMRGTIPPAAPAPPAADGLRGLGRLPFSWRCDGALGLMGNVSILYTLPAYFILVTAPML